MPNFPQKLNESSLVKRYSIKSAQGPQGPQVSSSDVKRSFEKNFHSLVSAIVKEQFPDLEKYSLGFQLVDKSPNNDKALGIYAVRLRTIGFIPFIFDEGKIKGYDVIYLPKYDLFLPTTELWLSLLKQKDSDVFDRLVDEDYLALATSSYPNLIPLRRPVSFSPGGIAKSSNLKVASIILKHPGMCGSLVATFDKYPFFIKKALVRFGKKTIDQIIKVAKKGSSPAPVPRSRSDEIEVYTETTARDLGILPPWMVDRIQKVGYYIVDRRKYARKEVLAASHQFASFPIDKPGCYDVVTGSDLKLRKGYVYRLVTADGEREGWLFIPETENAVYEYAYPYLESESRTPARGPVAFKRYPDESIFPKKSKKVSDSLLEALQNNDAYEIFRALVPEGITSGRFVFIDSKGNAFVACSCCSRDITFTRGSSDTIQIRSIVAPGNFGYRSNIPASKILVSIPEDARYVIVDESYYRNWEPISPLAIYDLLSKEGNIRVKVSHFRSNDRYYIDGQEFNRLDALLYLMRNYGLRQAPAEKMLKEACRREVQTFWIKRAEFPLIESKENPQAWFPSDYPTGTFAPGYVAKSKIEVDYIVPGLKKPKPVVNIMEPPPEQVIKTLQKIDEANNGEVFDVALLAALLKTTRDENLIDIYLPKLILALDSLGRILFNLILHSSAMKERYDELDYEKIVDNTKSCLESLGDLVVDLSQKDVVGYFEEAAESRKGDEE